MNKYKIKMREGLLIGYDDRSDDMLTSSIRARAFLNFVLNDELNPYKDKIKLLFSQTFSVSEKVQDKRWYKVLLLDTIDNIYSTDVSLINVGLFCKGILLYDYLIKYKDSIYIKQNIINKILAKLTDEQIEKYFELISFYDNIRDFLWPEQLHNEVDMLEDFIVVSPKVSENFLKTIEKCEYKLITRNKQRLVYHLNTNNKLDEIKTILKLRGIL